MQQFTNFNFEEITNGRRVKKGVSILIDPNLPIVEIGGEDSRNNPIYFFRLLDPTNDFGFNDAIIYAMEQVDLLAADGVITEGEAEEIKQDASYSLPDADYPALCFNLADSTWYTYGSDLDALRDLRRDALVDQWADTEEDA